MRLVRFIWVKLVTTIANLLGLYKHTKLYAAVISNDFEKVKELVTMGADVRFAKHPWDSFSPYLGTILFDALYDADDIRIAKLLYDHGAKLVDRDRQLGLLIYLNKYHAVKFLIGRGAKLRNYHQLGHFQISVPYEEYDKRIVKLIKDTFNIDGPYEWYDFD